MAANFCIKSNDKRIWFEVNISLLTFCIAASQARACFFSVSGDGITVSLTSSISSCSLYFNKRPLTDEPSEYKKNNLLPGFWSAKVKVKVKSSQV